MQWYAAVFPLSIAKENLYIFTAGESCKNARCAPEESCVADKKNNIPRCVRCDLNCTATEYHPVCGSDGVTYSSWCQLQQNSCSFGVLINVDKVGPCQNQETGEWSRHR